MINSFLYGFSSPATAANPGSLATLPIRLRSALLTERLMLVGAKQAASAFNGCLSIKWFV